VLDAEGDKMRARARAPLSYVKEEKYISNNFGSCGTHTHARAHARNQTDTLTHTHTHERTRLWTKSVDTDSTAYARLWTPPLRRSRESRHQSRAHMYDTRARRMKVCLSQAHTHTHTHGTIPYEVRGCACVCVCVCA